MKTLRTYNVAFISKVPHMGGGIAEVEIEPTQEMLMNELRAHECEHSAIGFRNIAFKMGHRLAQEKFFSENPECA